MARNITDAVTVRLPSPDQPSRPSDASPLAHISSTVVPRSSSTSNSPPRLDSSPEDLNTNDAATRSDHSSTVPQRPVFSRALTASAVSITPVRPGFVQTVTAKRSMHPQVSTASLTASSSALVPPTSGAFGGAPASAKPHRGRGGRHDDPDKPCSHALEKWLSKPVSSGTNPTTSVAPSATSRSPNVLRGCFGEVPDDTMPRAQLCQEPSSSNRVVHSTTSHHSSKIQQRSDAVRSRPQTHTGSLQLRPLGGSDPSVVLSYQCPQSPLQAPPAPFYPPPPPPPVWQSQQEQSQSSATGENNRKRNVLVKRKTFTLREIISASSMSLGTASNDHSQTSGHVKGFESLPQLTPQDPSVLENLEKKDGRGSRHNKQGSGWFSFGSLRRKKGKNDLGENV